MTQSPNIFIYQMGKVGSVSFQVAIREKGLRTNHGHWIQYPDGEFNTSKAGLIKIIKRGTRGNDWKVITPVREPMDRNISAFFQQIEKYYPKYRNYEYTTQITDAFIERYNHKWPDLWFEKELMDVFEVDVYAAPFNHEKGYQIYKSPYGEVMIIRLEDSERVIGEAMKEYLGKEGVEMAHSNVLLDRHNGTRIGKIYPEFRESSIFSEEFLDEVYSLKYAQHFYTDEEREEFKMKWLRGK